MYDDDDARAERVRTIRTLAAQITELAGHLNAANYRLLALIAEFDRLEGWSDGATQSCAHWLNWKCGIGFGAAREKVRVAHALEKLPRIAAAMARGELSYSKVRALTRVACAGTEEYFLSIALRRQRSLRSLREGVVGIRCAGKRPRSCHSQVQILPALCVAIRASVDPASAMAATGSEAVTCAAISDAWQLP